ncbi:MAG: lactonase family protein [Flagellimonas sp.]
MYLKIILATLVFCLPFQSKNSNKNCNSKSDSVFYVGTYTRGDSKGIYQYKLLKNGKLEKMAMVAEETNPSHLVKSHNNKFLLAVNEIGDDRGMGGQLTSYQILEDQLKFINRVSSGGAFPCYVSIDESGLVLTSNYSSGTVGLLKLSESGELSEPLDISQHKGQGASPRQKGPHAHMTVFEPDGNTVVSVDLGTNELWFYTINEQQNKLVPSNPEKLELPGSGPRYLAYHPNGEWSYVINELSSSVTQLKIQASGEYELLKTVSTLPTAYTGENHCADIHISKDGKFLYASNRGHNSIAIFTIDPKDGSLTLVENESVLGDWPRDFTFSPREDFLLVANQKSNSIVSFRRNKENGRLEYIDQIEAPSPVCLLF